jgi:hypothetical protein
MNNILHQIWLYVHEPLTKGVLLFTAVLITIVVAAYFLINWRDRNKQTMTANEHLSDFREIHRRGMISDSEFRTIKGRLGAQIVAELARADSPDDGNLTKSQGLNGAQWFVSREP